MQRPVPRPRKSRIYIYWKNGRATPTSATSPRGVAGRRRSGPRMRAPQLDEAVRLCALRLAELEAAKRAHPEGTPEDDPLARIAAFAGYHLACLEKRRKRGLVPA